MKYGTKWPEYARQWDAMAINSEREVEFRRIAQFAVDHKARYQAIEALTGVSWPHIAVLHRRESDADFDTYLGNGEPLDRVTRLVPKGRGPFTGPDAFEKGAVDALHLDGLDEVPDWRLEKILYYCEVFNGAGYANRGLPSPYIWGGTNQQRPGKYVADGVFDPNAMDRQPGCAPILAMIARLDPSVKFVRETPMGVEPPTTPEPPMADATTTEILRQLNQLSERIDALARIVNFGKEVLDPVKTTPKANDPAATTTTTPPVAATDPIRNPVNFGTLITSLLAMVVAPATGLSESVDKGTLGSLIPVATAVASGFGLPGWVLPLAGQLITRLTGGSK